MDEPTCGQFRVGHSLPPMSAQIAFLGFIVSGLIIGALHFIAPTALLDPYRTTISQYSLTSLGWLFSIGVIALVVGSAAAIVTLLSTRQIRVGSVGFWMLLIWTLGMAGVAVFEKTNWAYGPSTSGTIHRMLSIAAFIALPIGVLWIVAQAVSARRSHRLRRGRTALWASAVLGAASAGYLIYVVVLIVNGTIVGQPWWQTIPLGLTERVLVVTEVAALAALVMWARQCAQTSTATDAPIIDAQAAVD
ncbi:MAG: DUF998 domain-containing protein [Antricoccus sp.]